MNTQDTSLATIAPANDLGPTPPNPIDSLLRPISLVELATWLTLPRSTLDKYLAEGMRNIGVKIGKQWRFRPYDVLAWLESPETQKRLRRRTNHRTVTASDVTAIIPARLKRRQRRSVPH
jgi:hypothetical protein